MARSGAEIFETATEGAVKGLGVAQNDYDLAKENYATALENQALSERIKQKNTTKFFEGLASSFELRQAQLQLFNSQQNVIQSMRQVIISKSELDILINNPQ